MTCVLMRIGSMTVLLMWRRHSHQAIGSPGGRISFQPPCKRSSGRHSHSCQAAAPGPHRHSAVQPGSCSWFRWADRLPTNTLGLWFILVKRGRVRVRRIALCREFERKSYTSVLVDLKPWMFRSLQVEVPAATRRGPQPPDAVRLCHPLLHRLLRGELQTRLYVRSSHRFSPSDIAKPSRERPKLLGSSDGQGLRVSVMGDGFMICWTVTPRLTTSRLGHADDVFVTILASARAEHLFMHWCAGMRHTEGSSTWGKPAWRPSSRQPAGRGSRGWFLPLVSPSTRGRPT